LPEGLSCYIKWGDGDIVECGPYNSGEEVILSHTWDKNGTYIIRAIAKDVYGFESNWITLTVTMPKNKVIDRPSPNFLQNFIQSHPNMFLILQKMIKRFGLQ